jgi:hypothetical protein
MAAKKASAPTPIFSPLLTKSIAEIRQSGIENAHRLLSMYEMGFRLGTDHRVLLGPNWTQCRVSKKSRSKEGVGTVPFGISPDEFIQPVSPELAHPNLVSSIVRGRLCRSEAVGRL